MDYTLLQTQNGKTVMRGQPTPGRFQRHVEERRAPVTIGAALIILVTALAACGDGNADIDVLIETAREDFIAFDFIAARGGFEKALEKDPNNADAAYGYARTLGILQQYEEAIPAFERALELVLENPMVHAQYLDALAWGGILRGRRDWLDRAREAGQVAIQTFPSRVGLYDAVERALEELNDPHGWLEMLDAIEPQIPESPVFRIHHVQAELEVARAANDAAAADAIVAELRSTLEDGEANVVALTPESKAMHGYYMAAGYDALGDNDGKRRWLDSLEAIPEGRAMGDQMVYYQHYIAVMIAAREAPPNERRELTERWIQRFAPTWETNHYIKYARARDAEFRLLAESMRKQHDDGVGPSDSLIDQTMAIARELAHLDTWGGISYYKRAVQLLNDLEVRPLEALSLAGEAIDALNEKRPGLMYPGITGSALDRRSARYVGDFEHLRGNTLAAMGRIADAEQALRAAVKSAPDAAFLASLGEFLIEHGTEAEALETLIAAIARNTEDDELGSDSVKVHEQIAGVAMRLGRDEESIEAALAEARAEVAREARRSLTEDRLDRAAPDLSLTDTEGNTWRLSELRGKVVVLNYWATWCGPCRSEFPHYQELVASYAAVDDVVMLAITTDSDQIMVREFLDENEYRFTVLFDEGSQTEFGILGIPAHVFVGKNGRIQYQSSGFPGAKRYREEMRLRIEALRQL